MSDNTSLRGAIGLSVILLGMVFGSWMERGIMIDIDWVLVCVMCFWAGLECGWRYALKKVIRKFEEGRR